jgi:hypothetical protein
MKNNLTIFLYKTLFFILPVFILFEILFRTGFYPIITNSSLFDYKMFEVQKQHLKKVELLSIGSSIGLYDVNSGVIVQNFKRSYYNFSSWGLTMADMNVMLKSFVKDYRPETVLICSSLGDFMSAPNDSYLNYLNTSSCIRNNFPEYFYCKNYSSIHQIIFRKYNAYRLAFDPWGGASLTIDPKDINRDKWNEHFLFPTDYTQSQYMSLDSLSAFLREQKIRFIFAQAPIKASYANTASARQKIEAHFDRCKSIVEGRGGVYLNYYDTATFTDRLFFDQSHLQAGGGVILTRKMVADLKTIVH